ncbi:uncharacterized protein isoform X1 [Rhodnius prolixus]|uniref:uncharacterized protein isoform X1 n=2 Tax=Rhodnius prolixus TaxID=13249 RepID=UPI003D1884B8
MEQYAKEEKQIEEETNNLLKEIMREPKSVVTGILTYDGKVLNSPTQHELEPYIPHLGPFTKRCMLVAKSLDPHEEALGYSMWTSFGTYTIVFGEEFYAFARQDPIVMPIIAPKPLEELSETERNERLEEEHKQLMRQEKEKAKEEAAIKLEILKKEQLKRKTVYEKEPFKKVEKSEDDITEEESVSSESSETEEEDEGETAEY